MKKKSLMFILFVFITLLSFSCEKKSDIYKISIIEFNDSPMTAQIEKGILKALNETHLIKDSLVEVEILNAHGDFPTIISIVQKASHDQTNCFCCISTPCLQNCINLVKTSPIVFSGVANPFLAGAGKSAEEHLPNVTGVATRSPFRETFKFITKLFPETKAIGTLYSPSELNSEYYMETQKKIASEFSIRTEVVPVNSTTEIKDAVESLLSKEIDLIYQISDNLTNLGFETIVQGANSRQIPLFCNQSTEVKRGAAAGLGWDFEEAGYAAGKMLLRVYQGESPAKIPIQFMTGAKISLNPSAARSQGIVFPDSLINMASKVFK